MEKREQIKSYPLALAPPRDHQGAGTRAAGERGEGRPYAPPAYPVATESDIGRQPRNALPRGTLADASGTPGNSPAPTRTMVIIDARGRNPELQPKIPSPFLAQHIAQEVLEPEDDPSRHRAGSAAYLTVRDSTTEILGAAGLFDLIV